MENGVAINPKISAEDVISKIKDDGDFDRLRLKIIRKLKEDEELRNSIKAVVKESAALNRTGAENLKRRQLSDAIHQEVGDKVMSQISDGLWEIIRSGDGMKSEITETVRSVYVKLTDPNMKEKGETWSSPSVALPLQTVADDNVTNSVCENDETIFDCEPQEPPGFSISHPDQNNKQEEQAKELQGTPAVPQEQNDKLLHPSLPDGAENGDADLAMPPGFPAVLEPQQSCSNNEDDPEVPPGFGFHR